jgi:hypothetical protein
LSNWLTLVGGGAVIVVIGLLERLQGVEIPSKSYWILVFLLLFVAFFQAWRDEHRRNIKIRTLLGATEQRLKDAEKTHSPSLSGFVDEIAMGTPADGSKQTAIFLTVSVRNRPGALASVAEGWSVSVEIPNRGKLPCQIIHSDTSFQLHRSEGAVITYAPNEAIYEKTATPIQGGAMKRGTLACMLSDFAQDEVWQAGTTINVTFLDGNGQVVRFDRTMTAAKDAPLHFPGVQSRIAPEE